MKALYVVIVLAIIGLAGAYLRPAKQPDLVEVKLYNTTKPVPSDATPFEIEELLDQEIEKLAGKTRETENPKLPEEPIKAGGLTEEQINKYRAEIPGYDAHYFFGRLTKNDQNTERLIQHIRHQNEKLEWSEPIRQFLGDFHASLGEEGEMIVECGEALCVVTGDLDPDDELQPLALSFSTHLEKPEAMNLALTQSWSTETHGWVMFVVATDFEPPF